MRFLHSILIPAILSFAIAAAVPQERAESEIYDAIIVGGGPAGLSALSGLARVRRNVLLLDSGVYRNAPTRHMHDVLGFDGVTPAYYRWAAREQLSYYDTVTMKNATVTKITPQQNNTRFSVTAVFHGKGKKPRTVTARKIVLATGLHDILPGTPGVQANWGKGIFWCPWCDGHEHADQPLGLLAGLDEIPGMVREMLTLNTDIVAFVNGTDTPELRAATEVKSPEWQTYLDIHNVTIENRTISEIKRLRDGTNGDEDPSLPSVAETDLFSVRFSKGRAVERAAFLASFGDEQASKVGENMGVNLWGGRLAVDPTAGLVTNIPGVYAVGDANSDNVTNVPHALFSGKRTAVFLHVRLERENAAIELADAPDEYEGKRNILDERSVWERMNGERGDILYAGEFEQ
ncbi:sulphydryl oxidase [Dactylonectria estremocensis]|uniref:Sulphydryl oxidase n=1 Tax=Dactylonectria estremocensis TaxID=1079267 RepID=A0A9P9EN53_9HYPO|nr:sulphydryl oxidase [Dactylonectria estremocensis]